MVRAQGSVFSGKTDDVEMILFGAVLCAAFLHAFWNFLLKGNDDKALAMCAVTLGHLPFCIIGMVWFGLPDSEAFIYVCGGAILHCGYQISLMSAYRFGDLAQVYPVARGLSPLLLTLATFLFGQDSLTAQEVTGIALVSLALFLFGYTQITGQSQGLKGLILSVVTGVFIASYSLVDALGTRITGSALSFYSLMSAMNAVMMMVYFWFRHKPSLLSLKSRGMKIFWIGGSASYLAYVTVLWACLYAPIAVVSSLRETSVLFALFLSVVFLGEKLNLHRGVATVILLCGVVLMRLA